jgi:hypothetical protein
MDEERKLALLRKIAHAFTQAQISWALGASCFLYLQGIAPTFHDLDLMVKEADAPKAVEILSSLGQRFPPSIMIGLVMGPPFLLNSSLRASTSI